MGVPLKYLLLSLPFLAGIWFAAPAHAERVTCESIDRERKRCPMDTRGGVELIRQLSDKTCRDRWTYGRGYVEVRDGCRAQFESDRYADHDDPEYYGRITCFSEKGRTRRCRLDAGRNGARLVRQLSHVSCEGRWYYDDGYVIVRDGCRGEFQSRRSRY